MESLDKSIFSKFRTVNLKDEGVDMTEEEKVEYLKTLDESKLKFKEGYSPTWFYFKSMTYKEVISFGEDTTTTMNYKAVEAFRTTFIGVGKGNGKLKTVQELLDENPEFSGPDAIANLITDAVGFEVLVSLGMSSISSSFLGKKNKRSLV